MGREARGERLELGRAGMPGEGAGMPGPDRPTGPRIFCNVKPFMQLSFYNGKLC